MRLLAICAVLALLTVPAASAAPPDVEETGDKAATCPLILTQPFDSADDIVRFTVGFVACLAA